jgi:predicted DNA-binding ribbon-helix-helix protein
MKSSKRKATDQMVRVSVSFERSDYREMEAIAREKKVSVAWVVRHAVERYLTEQNPLFRGIQESGEKDN